MSDLSKIHPKGIEFLEKFQKITKNIEGLEEFIRKHDIPRWVCGIKEDREQNTVKTYEQYCLILVTWILRTLVSHVVENYIELVFDEYRRLAHPELFIYKVVPKSQQQFRGMMIAATSEEKAKQVHPFMGTMEGLLRPKYIPGIPVVNSNGGFSNSQPWFNPDARNFLIAFSHNITDNASVVVETGWCKNVDKDLIITCVGIANNTIKDQEILMVY